MSVLVFSLFVRPLLLLSVFLFTWLGIGVSLLSLDAVLTHSLLTDVRGIVTSISRAMRFIGVAADPPVVAVLMKHDLFWMISLFALLALGGSILVFKQIQPS